MRKEQIKIKKNKRLINGNNKVAANEGQQRRLYRVAADEWSLAATIESPLMTIHQRQLLRVAAVYPH